MEKIKEYKVSQKGLRAFTVTIPKIFVHDNNLTLGDKLEVHRGKVDGKDALILIPKKISQRTESKVGEAV